jgi:ribose-phosphate pyrophosphokinase
MKKSTQWVSEVARISDAPYTVLRKRRLGDRNVRIAQDGLKPLGGATPVIIDDVISSGRTMLEAIRIAAAFSDHKPLAIAVHGIFVDSGNLMLEREGARLITSNSIPHTSNQIDIAGLLASELAHLV